MLNVVRFAYEHEYEAEFYFEHGYFQCVQTSRTKMRNQAEG